MLKNILAVMALALILSCSKSNPTGITNNQISIFLNYNNTDARGTSCYIYEDNKINHIIPVCIAYDTLTAANGSTLRAEYSVSGYATVSTTVAKDQLCWVISTNR